MEAKGSAYQKRMSVMNPKISAASSDQLSLEDPDKINQLYVAVLDHLLTPPHVKEQLIDTQSLEKKLQTVRMHNHLFDSMNSWGDKENMLLNSIQKMKLPDIPTLSRLKIILATGNFEMMSSFLDSGGVSILLKAIETRLMKKPVTELDIAILFEILSCFKAIMKSTVGMEGVAKVEGSIDVIALCLRFDYKQFALQILEILSVCSFYSEDMAMKVLHAMKGQARFNQEAPYACLARALVEQDIEVKAAVMQFVNALIMAISDTKLRLALRSELRSQLFDETLEQAQNQIERELAFLNNERDLSPTRGKKPGVVPVVNSQIAQKRLQRKSMVTMFGPRAYDERKVDAMIKNTQLLSVAVSDTGSIIGNQIEIRSNQYSVVVNPLEGTMAGLLHAAKNADKIESRFLDIVGGKKTKRRWYELDHEHFKWCGGHDKDADYKGLVKVSTITDIRPFTTDSYVAAECQHCFEIETTERTYAVGCETATEKDNWLTALQRCRDNYLMSKGSYKLQFRELSTADVNKFAGMFQKQAANYQAIAVEDRRHQLEVIGLDLTNMQEVSRYLQLESIASGNTRVLSVILFELLLIPPGAEGIWESIAAFIPLLRQRYIRDTSKLKEVMENDSSFLDVFRQKFKDSSNTSYNQVSKLALTLMNTEQEVSRLQQQIEELNKTVAELQSTVARSVEQSLNYVSVVTVSNPISSRSAKTTSEQAPKVAKTSLEEAPKVIPSPPSPPPSESQPPIMSSPPIPTPPEPSPLSETLSATPATTTIVADPRYEKYEKMKKMLPEGAVRQKMNLDGFSEVEIESFFDGSYLTNTSQPPLLSSPPPPPTSATADPRYEKYEKMKKMLPEGAVRQKMNLDGFSETEIESFFDGSYLTNVSQPVSLNPAASQFPPAPSVDVSRFEKYEKMKKMLPEGAVRQKMNLDGFSEAEIESFFSGSYLTSPSSSASAPAPAPAVDLSRFEKYEKMRKMLPEGAVRQKMNLEGISESEINAFFDGSLSAMLAKAAATPSSASAVSSAPVDPRYEKFEKMKKMLPEGAVRQKMGLEGFSEQEINDFFAGKVGGGAPIPATPSSAPPSVVDPKFEKYEKMRKMLPEGAVRQKMTQEGLTQTEIDAFFGSSSSGAPKPPVAAIKPKPVEEEPPAGMKAKPKIKPSAKLRGLFWNKLKAADVKETVWFQLPEYSLSSEEVGKLEEHFANNPSTAGNSSNNATPKTNSSQPKLISVLDGKRTQNILILLGKLRKSPEEVLLMIIELNPKILTQEVTNSLIEIVPTAEETTAIKAFSNPLTLDLASQMIFHLNRLPKLAVRLECHEMSFSWEINAKVSSNQLNALLKGCREFQQLKDSFQSLLAVVLAIGNHINGDTARGQAYGVKLDVLVKFANLKATIPSQGTLMTYLANIIEERYPKLIPTFSELSPAVLACADISYRQLQQDVTLLETQYNKVMQELEKIKEGKENPGLDSLLEDNRGKSVGPLYQRLTAFKQRVTPILQDIKSSQKKADDILTQILTYYNNESFAAAKSGAAQNPEESGAEGGDAVKKFFGMVLDFSRLFQAAVEENKQKRLLQEKLQQQQTLQEGKDQKDQKVSAPAPMLKDLKKGQSDIFGQFHNAQKASNDQLLEEFKNKLKRQLK
eukprot:gene11521-12563_t